MSTLGKPHTIGIGRNGPLIDRAYREAPPDQYLRELVQNAIEAKATDIRIVPDLVLARQTDAEGERVMQLLIVDNGEGMSRDALETYFDNISLSSKGMGEHENFGIGARVATLPANPYGVDVMSWQDGEGGWVRMSRNESGEYQVTDVLEPPPPGYGVDPIGSPNGVPREHGTIVVLRGKGPKDKTFVSNLHRPLNRRYWALPEGVSVKVFDPMGEGNTHKWGGDLLGDDFDWSGRRATNYGSNRTICGTRATCENLAIDTIGGSHGKVEITGATVHWFILPQKGDDDAGWPPGTIGVVYQNEIYEVVSGTKTPSRFRQFGIYSKAPREQVSLFVEPDYRSQSIFPNGSRSRLFSSNGQDLPWEQWGFEFSSAMPPEIKALIQALDTPPPDIDDVVRRIEERVQDAYKDLLSPHPSMPEGSANPPRGKVPTPVADLFGTETAPGGGPGKESPGGGGSASGTGQGSGPSTGNPGTHRPKVRVKYVEHVGQLPRIEIRDLGEPYAAVYDDRANQLVINRTFPTFKESIRRMADKYGVYQDSAKLENTVLYAYGSRLCAKILEGVAFHKKMAEENPTGWGSKDRESLLNPQALTLAVLGHDADDFLSASIGQAKGKGLLR